VSREDNPPPAPPAEPAPPESKVVLPPFGLAKDVLAALGGAKAPASGTPAAAPTPPVFQGRDAILQFADSLLNVGQNENPTSVTAEEHLVTFRLEREEFGVPIMRTREIVRVGAITRIPEAPPHIQGVFNLRGRIVPVVDLRTRLGLARVEITPESRLVLVDAYDRALALLVDQLSRITRVPVSSISPAPTETLSPYTDYVRGVAQLEQRIIVLLDLDKVLLLPAGGRERAGVASGKAPQPGASR
jgi:purine-binding chemotaxis protein CheW